MASLLLISRKAPYGNSYARETLDIALAASAFDVKVSLLFMGDGVFQLIKNQNTQASNSKNVEAVLSSFPLYEINDLLVEEASLKERHLSSEDLAAPVKLCDDVAALFAAFDRVLTI